MADEAIEDTGLHTFDGIAADDLIRADDFDTRQFRRALDQGVCRDADARADGAAEVIPFLVDGTEGRRRAEVDDDDRAAEFFIRCNGVDDAVGTDFTGIVVFDVHARLDTRSDNQRCQAEIALAHAFQRGHDRRYDRRNDDGIDFIGVDAVQIKEVANEDAVFIGRPEAVRRYAPVVHELFSLENAQDNICIPYIND